MVVLQHFTIMSCIQFTESEAMNAVLQLCLLVLNVENMILILILILYQYRMHSPILSKFYSSLCKLFCIMKLAILFLGLSLSAGALFIPLPLRTPPSNIITKILYETRYISIPDDPPTIPNVTFIEAKLENLPRGASSLHTLTSTFPKSAVWPPKTQDLPNLTSHLRAAPLLTKSQVHSARAFELHDFDVVQSTTVKLTSATSVITASSALKSTVQQLMAESAVQTLTLKLINPLFYDFNPHDFSINATEYLIVNMDDIELYVPFPISVTASLCKRITGCFPQKNKSSSQRDSAE